MKMKMSGFVDPATGAPLTYEEVVGVPSTPPAASLEESISIDLENQNEEEIEHKLELEEEYQRSIHQHFIGDDVLETD